MSLNKVKGNMYDWIGPRWNPLAGACPHFCKYCYTQNFRFPILKEKYSGPPRLYENELKRNLGKDKFWFVGSCIDIFAEDIHKVWLLRIFDHCKKYNNKYLFQSKNPARIYRMRSQLPPNVVLGTTIETNRQYPEMGNTPNIMDRARSMAKLKMRGYRTIITIEPIMDFDLNKLPIIIEACRPDWVNIGSNTNFKVKLPEPSPEKVRDLIETLKEFTEIKIKPNLKRLEP